MEREESTPSGSGHSNGDRCLQPWMGSHLQGDQNRGSLNSTGERGKYQSTRTMLHNLFSNATSLSYSKNKKSIILGLLHLHKTTHTRVRTHMQVRKHTHTRLQVRMQTHTHMSAIPRKCIPYDLSLCFSRSTSSCPAS